MKITRDKMFFQKILFILWRMSECLWQQLYPLELVSLVYGWLRYKHGL